MYDAGNGIDTGVECAHRTCLKAAAQGGCGLRQTQEQDKQTLWAGWPDTCASALSVHALLYDGGDGEPGKKLSDLSHWVDQGMV